MNRQEVYDAVARHLLTQNERAVDPITGECKYKTSSGLRCAIGCLIPDIWDPESLRGNISNLPARLCEEVFGITGPGKDKNLLWYLQRVHDGTPVHSWPQALKDVAQNCGLSTAVVDEMRRQS